MLTQCKNPSHVIITVIPTIISFRCIPCNQISKVLLVFNSLKWITHVYFCFSHKWFVLIYFWFCPYHNWFTQKEYLFLPLPVSQMNHSLPCNAYFVIPTRGSLPCNSSGTRSRTIGVGAVHITTHCACVGVKILVIWKEGMIYTLVLSIYMSHTYTLYVLKDNTYVGYQ